ncbi:MAG: hypothetical protein F6K14_15655 [Symploca sp. SIO2C1]|nr:hypothetical protein [Symploca sp. SIO2C1]
MSQLLTTAIATALSGLVAIPATTTITAIFLTWGITPFFAVGSGLAML